MEAEGNRWKLTGDLTIRDITKPVTLDMEFVGVAADPWGNSKAAFEASGELERKEWNLTWNVPLAQGGVLVSDTFKIEIEAQAAPPYR
jgi:polyisoprenoid-binding protein YceI